MKYPIQNLLLSVYFLFLGSMLLTGCKNNDSGTELISNETIKSNNTMIYKFYKSKTAGKLSKAEITDYIKAFGKIYDENHVDVIGTWYNLADSLEVYYMTGYSSEQSYTAFVTKMKTHEEYQRMSKEMGGDIVSIEGVTLRMFLEE